MQSRGPQLHSRRASTAIFAAIAILVALLNLGFPVDARAVNVPQSTIVTDNPANFTPNVLDGQVNAVIQIGNKMIVGGSFTQVQASSGGVVLSRSNIFAFDATTGVIDTSFAPTINNGVDSLAAPADGSYVIVSGQFTSVNGSTFRRLVKLNPANGQIITAFNPNPSGRVRTIALRGSHLFVAGSFTAIGGQSRTNLADVNPTTGAVSANLNLPVTDARQGATASVFSMDANPDGSKLVIIGNFTKIAGQTRWQVGMIDMSTTPATVANWETDRYTPDCNLVFDTYMRDVDFSPNGDYFVIVATGAGYPGTLCDSAARWESNATGTALQPTWSDLTGGDTLSKVAVTGTAVYIGGHQRWVNNPFAADFPGPGAIDRPGIAALDPVNGLPYSWNPTKDRGVGVFELYSTTSGLWVGSDTDQIGGETHRKLGFFPLAGGTAVPSTDPYTLPGNLYNVPASPCTQVDTSILFRVNAGGPQVAASDCGPNWVGDDSDGATGAQYRNTGSNAVSSWGQSFTQSGTVPATTPSSIFDSERWDPSDPPEMQWQFPVQAGTPLQVRLYFINQCGCTSGAGQRSFNVAVDGTTVLNNYDIVSDVGDRVGTMKAFNITSDGTVNIDLSHVVENPLINGIEIVRTDVSPVSTTIDYLTHRTFDGTTPDAPSNLDTPAIDWSQLRGAFAVHGMLYHGWSDGNFYARSFDGSSVGAAEQIDLHGLTDFSTQSITGMFLSNGYLYYTVQGDPQMYRRGFTPQSRTVGAVRETVSAACTQVDTSILFRVNAGGPQVAASDCGPNWVGDDSDGATGAQYRNTGSNAVSSWGQSFTQSGTVPATTPSSIFDSERWDPSDPPEMQWQFPVQAGTPLQVRLYFINQCGCTSGAGQRSFNVAVDGTTVLNNYDIVSDVGDRVGTMKAFNITSDGTVNIDLSHVVENPLINGIEIVRTDVSPVPTTPIDWSTTRGLTLANGKLYFARSNGDLYSMTFANGAPVRGTEALVSPASAGYDWASRALFVFPSAGSPPPPSNIFSDDFASGDFSNWTDVTRLTIDGAAGSPAAPSARAQVTNQSAFASRNLGDTYTSVCLSANVNLASNGGIATDLLRLRTAGNGPIARVLVSATGILQIRNDVASTLVSSGVALGTGWHNVEVCGTVGSSTWDLYRDGVKIVNAWAANTGTTPIGRIQIGDPAAKTFSANFDHVVVDQAPGDSGGPPDATPPTTPGKPAGQSLSQGTIQLSWAASTDQTPPITYRIYRDGGSTAIGSTTDTSFTDSGLTPSSTHTYRVDATDALNHVSALSPVSDPITVMAPSSTIFSDDFSSGDFSNWTGVTRLTIDGTTGGIAPPSARAEVTNQSAFAFKNLTGTFNQICMSTRVNAATLGTGSPVLLRLRTAGNGPISRVYMNSSTGVLWVKSDVSGTQVSSGVALGTGWHNLELCGTVGASGTWDLYRDGAKVVNAWTADTGTTPVGRVEIGDATAKTMTINFDDVVVDQVAG